MAARPPARSRSTSPTGGSPSKTKRSTVSNAYQTATASASGPPASNNSAVLYGNSTVKEHSVSRRPGISPAPASAAKDTSVVSVGTVTNPDATAAELLALKAPHITSSSHRLGPSGPVDNMTKASSMAALEPSVAASAKGSSLAGAAGPASSSAALGPAASQGWSVKSPGAPGASTASVAAGPAVSQNWSVKSPGAPRASTASVAAGPAVSQDRPVKSPWLLQTAPASKQPETMATSSMADGQPVSSAAAILAEPGHGLVDVNSRTGAKLEMVFSSLGALLFAGLWVFVLAFAKCFRDDTWIFLTKAFSAFGVVASLFVLFHSCFERRFAIGRGIFGCIIFFIIAVVIFLNLLDAFMAMNCICQCSSVTNAFSVGQSEDLTIFFLSLLGSFALIAVLLISSVAHDDDHHYHHNHNERQ